ncbi:hypothetical protein CAPTEDRAFT_154474 [Capitella teleta]|uniref:Alpha-galactosidase n=1 Tax=Capitella teleta TaxID=283909 RepID=R7V630_CAPTE|nr:hypothetical protein CAPTEDRAFT_154474 [Capitella teleta]|eukprot:ELU14039.1 hypothetical protein CAPTEDRAFT_154474 [Capitella teleta]
MMLRLLLFVLLVPSPALGLDNGLARTPPMGWLDWERFRCNTDCVNYPDTCIGEKLFKDMADEMSSGGYLEAGYEYVNIDDCWLAKERGPDGRLRADPDRFPSGIKGLADYVHSKGLKLGIYEDFGTKTCAGYPGSEYYLQMDAQTFADWGVDYLKLDGCYSDPHQYKDAYPAMSFWLNQTGVPILYSCSWPAYVVGAGDTPEYPLIAKYCNVWRNYGDIQDSWDSVSSIITFYGDDKGNFSDVAAPGSFNDPDMLIVGNFGLSRTQERVQMAMWCIMASPLIMSTDLRTINDESKALLLNKRAIAINQDALGVQGKRISKNGQVEVWTKPILPKGSFAFAFLNTASDGTPRTVSMKMADMGMTSANGYSVEEVFEGGRMMKLLPNDTMTAQVNPTGVFFGKATVM